MPDRQPPLDDEHSEDPVDLVADDDRDSREDDALARFGADGSRHRFYANPAES